MTENNIRRIFKEKMDCRWMDKDGGMVFTTHELNEAFLKPTMQDNPDPTSQPMIDIEKFFERFVKA